jgi:hypothetical protein
MTVARRLLITAALVVSLVLPAGVAAADQTHRARCHGEPRPAHGLGIPGGPWTCRPAVGWYWPIPDIYSSVVTYGQMGQR